VPKGSFYNHFASKEALAEETLNRYRATRRFELLDDTSKPPVARLRSHFEYLAGLLIDRGFVKGCLLGNFGAEVSDQSEVLRQAVATRLDRWSARVAGLLGEAQVGGDLPPSVDVERMGAFVITAWEGATLRAKVSKTCGPLDDFFAVVFDSLLA
jgi:TetR/AcrR family transcriptional regulator, transcriptional repressor for nem operon